MSAFTLAQYPEDHIKAYVEHVQAHGYNTVRVLAETGGWKKYNRGWLPPGPDAFTKAARKDIKKLLRVTAEMGIQVELVSSGTIRQMPFRYQVRWARKVAKWAKPFPHVFLNAMNEPQTSSLSQEEVLGLIRALKVSGLPVGVDSQAEAGHWRFPKIWKRECDWIGVHPRRSPELNLSEIQHVVDLNGLTLFNETTSYISDEEIEEFKIRVPNGLFYNEGMPKQGKRKAMARRYMRRFYEILRARWYYHMLAGLHCKGTNFWIPRYQGD